MAHFLKKNLKTTILLDSSGKAEIGCSLELASTKSKNYFFNGYSVDIFGSKKSLGVGVAKDIYSNDFVELDVGLYATRKFIGLLDKKTRTDIRIGFSGTVKF